MVIYCTAFGCKNEQDNRQLSFHRFPLKRPEILKLWIKAVRRKNWAPSKTSRLCQEHFLPSDYIVRPGSTMKLLKPDAVPSVFSYPKHLLPKNVEPRRKIRKVELSGDIHSAGVSDHTESPAGVGDHTESPAGVSDHTESPIDVNLPSTSTAPQAKMLVDRQTQTVSYNKYQLLRRKVRALNQKIRRRDKKITTMKEVIHSISKSGHSNESLNQVLKNHFQGLPLELVLLQISGYIVRNLISATTCNHCIDILLYRKKTPSEHSYTAPPEAHKLFINFVTRGGLLYASDVVYKILHFTEKQIRLRLECANLLQSKTNLRQIIINTVIKHFVANANLFKPKHPVIQEFVAEDCHEIQIVRKLTSIYLKCRMYHHAKVLNLELHGKNASVRQKMTKLVLFRNC